MSGDGIYTVRDLAERATEVIREIRERGTPAFITDYGRFVAMITPLTDGEVESRVLPEMAREIAEDERLRSGLRTEP